MVSKEKENITTEDLERAMAKEKGTKVRASMEENGA